MQSSSNLAWRAALALLLMVGFYGLAVAVAGLLLFIPYAEWTYGEQLHLRVALICVSGAAAILWGVIPRPDRFEPPGPRLDPLSQPRLFAELQRIAAATGEAMPGEVYLVPDLNAWVMQRGGVLGIGSRRVMGLGLPLLRVLKVTELGAVLAHEFGHYRAGDTRLGPWVYRTRAAIFRTLENLGGSLIRLPFVWYAKLFLLITHAVSRSQEYAADALAARVVGARHLVSGLRTIHAVAPAFAAYWDSELMPVLSRGYRPPMADGFAQFLAAPGVAEAVARHLDEELADPDLDPYDTHPALPMRLAVLSALPQGPEPGDDPPAISLLEGVPALEQQLQISMAALAMPRPLPPLSWEEVGARVYIPLWRDMAGRHAPALSDLPTALPDMARHPQQFGRMLRNQASRTIPDEELEGYAAYVVGAALAVRLADAGCTLDISPGAPVTAERDGVKVELFSVYPRLMQGDLTAEQWLDQAAALGMTGSLA